MGVCGKERYWLLSYCKKDFWMEITLKNTQGHIKALRLIWTLFLSSSREDTRLLCMHIEFRIIQNVFSDNRRAISLNSIEYEFLTHLISHRHISKNCIWKPNSVIVLVSFDRWSQNLVSEISFPFFLNDIYVKHRKVLQCWIQIFLSRRDFSRGKHCGILGQIALQDY